jgi:hypothetical protein
VRAELHRALTVLVVVAACGTSAPQGKGQVVGTLGGESLDVRDALSGCGLLSSQPTLHVDLFNLADACHVIATSYPDSERYLSLDLFDAAAPFQYSPLAQPGDAVVVPDDPMSPGHYAAVEYWGIPATVPLGMSGIVHVTAVDPASVSGSFDVILDTGEHVTGSFTAPHCAAEPASSTPNGGLFSCAM